MDVFEVEAQSPDDFDLLDEPGGLHLVDDLLLRFGLAYEVGIRTAGYEESR